MQTSDSTLSIAAELALSPHQQAYGLMRHGEQPGGHLPAPDWKGKVLHARMEIEETFFASRFAMLRGRFCTSWMLLHEQPQPLGARGV